MERSNPGVWKQGLWADPCSPEHGRSDLNRRETLMSIVGILIVILLILLVLYLVRRVV
jgi:flagellar biogenesis protein FliO